MQSSLTLPVPSSTTILDFVQRIDVQHQTEVVLFRRPVRTAACNCMFKTKIQFTVHSNDIAVSMFAVRQAPALSA